MVFWTTGKTTRSFRNQEFFEGFNWDNFTPGDFVWLEDYEGKDQTRIVGIYLGQKDNNPIVRLLANPLGKKIGRFAGNAFPDILDNILDIPINHWQQFGRILLAEANNA